MPRVTFVKGLLGFSLRLSPSFSLAISLSLSPSRSHVDRLFRPFFHPTHGGRVLNYPGRTSSSDCSAVIACQLSAFDVIKLILGPNFVNEPRVSCCPVFLYLPRISHGDLYPVKTLLHRSRHRLIMNCLVENSTIDGKQAFIIYIIYPFTNFSRMLINTRTQIILSDHYFI